MLNEISDTIWPKHDWYTLWGNIRTRRCQIGSWKPNWIAQMISIIEDHPNVTRISHVIAEEY